MTAITATELAEPPRDVVAATPLGLIKWVPPGCQCSCTDINFVGGTVVLYGNYPPYSTWNTLTGAMLMNLKHAPLCKTLRHCNSYS